MTYVPPINWGLEVARGNISGVTPGLKFGANGSVGTTLEDLYTGSTQYPFPTAAVTLEAISDSASDTAAGSGARTIRVFGLDSNWDEAQEDITMAGLSASSATTTSFIRVFRAYVLTSGVYALTGTPSNVGQITIRASSAGATLAVIDKTPEGMGQTEMGIYTVPDGSDLYFKSYHIQVDASKNAEIILWQRPDADTISAPYSAKRVIIRLPGVVGSIRETFPTHVGPFGPRTDLWASAKLSTGTGSVSAEFGYVLVPTGT